MKNNVVFVGHSLGGGLAAALSAGIALGAFEQKEDKDKKPIDDWSFVPDRSYKPDKPSEPLQDHVPVLTFNAPQMGWLFDKLQTVTGGHRIPRRDERLNDVDVMAIRTNRDPVSGFRLYGKNDKHTGNHYTVGGMIGATIGGILVTLGDGEVGLMTTLRMNPIGKEQIGILNQNVWSLRRSGLRKTRAVFFSGMRPTRWSLR